MNTYRDICSDDVDTHTDDGMPIPFAVGRPDRQRCTSHAVYYCWNFCSMAHLRDTNG